MKIEIGVYRVPKNLFKGIEKIKDDFSKKGLVLSNIQIAEKLGNDILNQHINIDIPVFKINNKKMINLGGVFNAKAKKIKKK